MTPIQFQKQIRLQEARVLLMARAADVAEIGYLVGCAAGFSRRAPAAVGTPLDHLRGRGGPATAQSQLGGYLEWATATVQQLGGQISAADIDQLVLTRGYDRLLSIAATMTGDDITTQRVLRGLVSLELTQLILFVSSNRGYLPSVTAVLSG